MFWTLLGDTGDTIAKACASPRNSTWFTRPFLLMRGWGLGTRLHQTSCSHATSRHPITPSPGAEEGLAFVQSLRQCAAGLLKLQHYLILLSPEHLPVVPTIADLLYSGDHWAQGPGETRAMYWCRVLYVWQKNQKICDLRVGMYPPPLQERFPNWKGILRLIHTWPHCFKCTLMITSWGLVEIYW